MSQVDNPYQVPEQSSQIKATGLGFPWRLTICAAVIFAFRLLFSAQSIVTSSAVYVMPLWRYFLNQIRHFGQPITMGGEYQGPRRLILVLAINVLIATVLGAMAAGLWSVIASRIRKRKYPYAS